MEWGASRQEGEVGGTADTDTVFAALTVRSRRVLLAELADASGQASAVELAHRLVVSGVGPAGSQEAYLELYHTHGPVLERAGLLEWDRSTGEMWLTEAGREAVEILEHLTASE